MASDRLEILHIAHMPASPPRSGAQARLHGLMTQLSRRHDLTAAVLVDEEFDLDECRSAMQAYCREVVLIPNPHGRDGVAKRLLQLRSLGKGQSFERLRVTVPDFQQTLGRLLGARRFDIVNLEFPYLGHYRLRQAPPGERLPPLIVDSHEMAYDLPRQFARAAGNPGRRIYGEVDWRKLRREELQTYRHADGVYLCSAMDEQRLLAQVPGARTTVVPNAADVDYFRPRASDPVEDGSTVVYFGLLSTLPNTDAVIHFAQSIWPKVTATHPKARWKIIGGRPPPSVQALAQPDIELTGLVPDLRPHLAEAAVVIVPLRLGGGTRLKIVEAMAMGKAIVSTTLGAEGIEAVPGRDILIADDPESFAASVVHLLNDASLRAALGASARRLAERRYSWMAAAADLEQFIYSVISAEVTQVRRSA